MNAKRFMLSVLVPATLGVAGTFVFAYARCNWARWDAWNVWSANPPGRTVGVGAGTPDERGLAWRWMRRSGFGSVECESLVVSAADREGFLPGNYRVIGWRSAPPPSWSIASEARLGGFAAGDRITDTGYGWPLPALASRVVTDKSRPGTPEMTRLAGLPPGETLYLPHAEHGRFWGDTTPWLEPDGEYWPTRVLWSGLVVDSAVLALILASPWLVVGGVRALVRVARRRRGACTGCGYDRVGLLAEAPCPECGSVANARRT